MTFWRAWEKHDSRQTVSSELDNGDDDDSYVGDNDDDDCNEIVPILQ